MSEDLTSVGTLTLDLTFCTDIRDQRFASVLASRDLDGDGFDDLAVGVWRSQRILIFFGSPSDTLRHGTTIMDYGHLATADVNGDGMADVVGLQMTPFTSRSLLAPPSDHWTRGIQTISQGMTTAGTPLGIPAEWPTLMETATQISSVFLRRV